MGRLDLKIKLNVNDEQFEVEVSPSTSLNDVLREELNLTGTKRGCDTGGCGVCTVLLDDKPVYSCMTPAWRAEGKKLRTVEDLSKNGKLDPIQQSFIKHSAAQCGYCTSAMLIVSRAFLDANPNPAEADLRNALCGVICRCTGYQAYVNAVMDVAKRRP
jgi:aerobic-type carbon monoxide dehydrogenase small subunit (CoxS/CutS family)